MVSIEVEVSVNLSPEKLAGVFCRMDSEQQANFLRAAAREMKGWDANAGQMQCCYLGDELKSDEDQDVREWISDIIYFTDDKKDDPREVGFNELLVVGSPIGSDDDLFAHHLEDLSQPTQPTNPCGEVEIGAPDLSPAKVLDILKTEKNEGIPFTERCRAQFFLKQERKEGIPCPDCNGSGTIELFTSTDTCDRCHGTGEETTNA